MFEPQDYDEASRRIALGRATATRLQHISPNITKISPGRPLTEIPHPPSSPHCASNSSAADQMSQLKLVGLGFSALALLPACPELRA
jgi:hypothetical protein